jgi:serine/threonine-protein kinase
MTAVAVDRDRVGPYVLVKAIGAGGSARIDLARIDRAYNFQRHVVIKRPLEHLRSDAKAAASLHREARIGARLRHPNLVAILDAGIHDGYDYLVLEYVHGGSLRALMQAEGSRVRDCPLDAALAMICDAARGLHAAHELTDEAGHPLGLVHRDVSPGNVLVGLDGAVKLADFGIAKETRVQTLSGSMHGTVTYMAPEQCRGHAFDRRADVFSLGVILYELVTGTRLFWADNDVASLHRVLSGNVPRPRKLRPHIAPALEEIVMTAVAHDQDKRFATARDLADAIEIYAHEAGALLAARRIAHWVHDLLGPRDAPWIGESTRVDVPMPRATSGDGSLVDLIAAEVDEPADPTFGPTLPLLPDEVDTDPRRDPPRKRRGAIIAAVIGVAAAAGIAAVVMMNRETSTPREKVMMEIESPLPPPPAAPPPAEVEITTPVETTVETPIVDKPPTERPTRRKPRRESKTTTPPVEAVVEDKQQPPPPTPGSGSQKPNTKVEWKPDLVLPTDPSKKR